MAEILGLVRVHVIRGINLVVRDVSSSDPYVVVKLGKQRLKTRVIQKNINPEWNEELTLSVTDVNSSIQLKVYDKDKLSQDDKMGDAEFEIAPFIEAVKKTTQIGTKKTVITKLKPSKENCLAEESCIACENGKVTQNMLLKLSNVERGEVELRLEWINVPGSKGL